MTPINDLTKKDISELLSYDPESGVLTWKVNKGTKSSGTTAGFVEQAGYVVLGINRRTYKAHRIAWLLYHGVWPDEQLDHIDGNRTNNRIENLRLASCYGNAHNQKRAKNNSSGYKGVSRHRQSGKWRAMITADGVKHSLGLYQGVEDAASAYSKAAKRLHGNFARIA